MSEPIQLLGSAIGAVVGEWIRVHSDNNRTFQAYGTATGTITATVTVEGSNDASHASNVDTLTLSGTTTAQDEGTSIYPWPYIRASVTTITGTGAAVVVTGGV